MAAPTSRQTLGRFTTTESCSDQQPTPAHLLPAFTMCGPALAEATFALHPQVDKGCLGLCVDAVHDDGQLFNLYRFLWAPLQRLLGISSISARNLFERHRRDGLFQLEYMEFAAGNLPLAGYRKQRSCDLREHECNGHRTLLSDLCADERDISHLCVGQRTFRASHGWLGQDVALRTYLCNCGATESSSRCNPQDGKYLLWQTDWLDELGCTNGTSVGCGVLEPDWAAGAYTTASRITPLIGNAGGYSFQPTGSCTASGSQPAWTQTIGSTSSDSGCTWTNIGQARTDVFMAQLPVSLADMTFTGLTMKALTVQQ